VVYLCGSWLWEECRLRYLATIGVWHWLGGVFIANNLCGVGGVVVRAVFPFPYLNTFSQGVTSAAVRVSDESRFEKPDEVGFVGRGSQPRFGVSRYYRLDT
jgi:hypothetical protein